MMAKRPSTWGVYGWVCDACQHPFSGHGLVADGDLRAGPYICQVEGCHCAVAQDSPHTGLTREQFEARFPESRV